MLNRSLATFMNAYTASDYTMYFNYNPSSITVRCSYPASTYPASYPSFRYPFSTCNRTDFENLLRVYVDAAFFPLLKEIDFRQEGT